MGLYGVAIEKDIGIAIYGGWNHVPSEYVFSARIYGL